jgi:hypothetical protein
MTLADDISRCLDDSCHLRETCARWVERDTGRPRQATFRRGLLPCCAHKPIRVAVDPAQGDMFGGGE